MLFLVVIAILLVMAVLPLVGHLLEDIVERVRASHGRGNRVRPRRDRRTPPHSLHR
jgi:hypothetical protein